MFYHLGKVQSRPDSVAGNDRAKLFHSWDRLAFLFSFEDTKKTPPGLNRKRLF
jgi:hypothetical protein